MGTWGSVFKPAQCKNGKEWNRVDKHSHLSPSNPKIPSWPKIPSFVDTPKCPAWRNPLLGIWDSMGPLSNGKFPPSYPKIPSCPKNTQLCRRNKIPSLESFLDMGQHGTTITWKTSPSYPKLKDPIPTHIYQLL